MELPSRSAIDELADQLRLGIPAQDVDFYHAAATGLLGSWAVVEELYDAEMAPSAPERAWSEPTDDPLGAWYVTTELSSGTDGRLSGRRVAVKDNIAVAGVPMKLA